MREKDKVCELDVKGETQGGLHVCEGAFPVMDKTGQLGRHDWVVRFKINFRIS